MLDLVVPNRAGKAKLYVKRMAIGEYTFAEGENEINFEQIQRDETSFYQAEFNRLNSRTKELLRYLRKSPEYMDRDYLQKMYEAALKGHSLQENSEQRLEDDKAEVSAVPGMTPKQRELNAISRAEKAVMSVKRFKDIIDDPKHLLAMAKRRVTLAYRRVQMAMHELENDAKVPREALLMMVSPRRQLQVISFFQERYGS